MAAGGHTVIFIVFRFKPSDPLFLLNVTSETRLKLYLFILCAAFAHISTMITKKSRDKYLFQIENQLYLVRYLWIGVTKWIAMAITDVNLSICMFIMVLYVNVSFLIDMLVYQDWLRTLTTCNCKSDVVLICWSISVPSNQCIINSTTMRVISISIAVMNNFQVNGPKLCDQSVGWHVGFHQYT